MLQWICHLRLTFLYWKGTEDTPFTTTMRIKFVKGVQNPLRWILPIGQILVVTVFPELGQLNVVGVVDPRGRSQWLLSLPKEA